MKKNIKQFNFAFIDGVMAIAASADIIPLISPTWYTFIAIIIYSYIVNFD